jgi:hypothetical protein
VVEVLPIGRKQGRELTPYLLECLFSEQFVRGTLDLLQCGDEVLKLLALDHLIDVGLVGHLPNLEVPMHLVHDFTL